MKTTQANSQEVKHKIVKDIGNEKKRVRSEEIDSPEDTATKYSKNPMNNSECYLPFQKQLNQNTEEEKRQLC